MADGLTLAVNGWRLHTLRTGVARYLSNILRHWTPENVAGRFSSIRLYSARPVPDSDLPSSIEQIVLPSGAPLLVWENTRLAAAVREDVLFCPAYSIPLTTRRRCVAVIHDATSHLYPHLFPRRARLIHDPLYGWSGRHAALVITDSVAGAEDITECYDVPRDRIRVVSLAPEPIFRKVTDDALLEDARARFAGGDVPFFLFVGKLSGRRNVPLLLEAFAHFNRLAGRSHKLLVVGANIHDIALGALVERLGIADDLVYHPRVTDEELVLLYNAAQAYVSPSVYETVCLPVMEAQACGTPVICVDTRGMREQTGGAACFIPKLEVGILSSAMKTIVNDSTLQDRLSKDGMENVKRFSWKRSSMETLKVLEEAASM